MRKILLESLYEKYDEINSKLQRDFVKMHYEDWQIEEMKKQLERLDEIINEVRKDQGINMEYIKDGISLYCMDYKEFLFQLPNDYIDLIITDPPHIRLPLEVQVVQQLQEVQLEDVKVKFLNIMKSK